MNWRVASLATPSVLRCSCRRRIERSTRWERSLNDLEIRLRWPVEILRQAETQIAFILQKCRERGENNVSVVACPKFLLAKHYNTVMFDPLRLITAASLKWMKWMAAAWWSGLRLLLYLDAG